MKRKIRIDLLAGVLVLMLLPWGTVQAEELAFDAYLGFDVDIMSPGWTSLTFYSNYSKLFYVFFQYNRPFVGFTTYYTTSADGINWKQNATRLFYPDSGSAWPLGSGGWDIYVEPNGQFIHGAVIKTATSPASVYYFKRELLKNGSLGTCGYGTRFPQQVFNEDLLAYGDADKNVDIYLDSEGYPFITFVSNDGGGLESGFLIAGDYPIPANGSWGNGDYTLTNWQNEFGNLWDDDWKVTVTGLSDGITETGFGRGVHWMQTHESAFASDQEESSSAHNYYNGSGWINEDGGGDSALWDHEGDWADECFDIVAIGNITLYVKQTEVFVAPDRIRLDYGTRIGGQDWENTARAVSGYHVGDAGAVKIVPHIAVDYDRNVVIVWTIYDPENSTVWYRKGNIGFDGIMTWQTNVTQWEDWPHASNWGYATVASGMGEPLPFNVPLSLSYEDETNDWIFHDYIFTENNGELLLPATHLNTTLYDPNGYPIGEGGIDNWLFEGEVYTVESYVENATSFFLNTSDSRHELLFRWDNSSSEMWVEVDPRDQFTVGLAHSEFQRTGNITRLLWRFILDRSIIDSRNNSWSYNMTNSDMGYSVSGDLGLDTHIYNLGGFTDYIFTGDGGRTPGGQPFEIFATNGSDGSSARAEQIYRKLQSVHLLFEIDMGNEWEGGDHFDIDPGVGFVDIGIDYRLNASWVEGFFVRLYVQDADVGHHAGANDHNWVEWSVDWYNYDPGTGTKQNFRSGLIYSNHWGYDNENLTPDYHNRTSSQIWVDLWFDRTNSSTTIAGQVNAKYHGMKEHGSAWWFGYGEFQPMVSDYGNALMLDDLYDEGGNVTDSMKFDLMRVFIEVGKVDIADGNDETWTIRAVENFNRKQADDRMQGVEQPAFEPTLVLDMPMFQSNNPLIRAIDGISRSIWMGALGFIKILWGAMDSIFEWAGFGPGFFSLLTSYIMEIPALVIVIMESLGVLMGSFVDIIEGVFEVLVLILPAYVGSFGLLAEALISYWGFFMDILGGGMGLDFSILEDIAIQEWINFGLWMLPFYEVWGIIWAGDVTGRLKDRMGFYSSIFNGLLNFIKGMIDLMSNLVQAIRSFLPI